MSQRKPWSQQEDQLLRTLIEQNEEREDKLKWGEIAAKLEENGSRRSGKQCRQRWHNQLKPGIAKERDWTPQEERVLFRVQQQLGNRWAQIAKELPGRTDNNIKNYFYSTLRKALRKVNDYVQKHKREPNYRNVKEFQQNTLSKILTVAERKYEKKINLRNEAVVQQAQNAEIKKMLVDIQRDETIVATNDYNYDLEEAVNHILQFNRNCRRKKFAKKEEGEQDEEAQESYHDEQEQKPQRRQPKKVTKKEVKVQTVKLPHEQQKVVDKINESSSIRRGSSLYSNNPNAPLRLSSSSNMNDLYSSFRGYHAGSGSSSQVYNQLGESRGYSRPVVDEGVSFINRIPNLQKHVTVKSNQLPIEEDLFWQDAGNIGLPPISKIFELSQNYGNFDDNQFRSQNLDNSVVLFRRASSRIQERRKSEGV